MKKNNQISLNQRSFLREILEKNPEHFGIYDLTDFWERSEKMTLRQYKYFFALLYNKHYFDAKKLLDQFLKHKIYDQNKNIKKVSD